MLDREVFAPSKGSADGSVAHNHRLFRDFEHGRDLAPIFELPWLYVPTAEPDMMRASGVARADGDGAVHIRVKHHPGALVAPRFAGEVASRDDLLYHGAEPAEEFCAS